MSGCNAIEGSRGLSGLTGQSDLQGRSDLQGLSDLRRLIGPALVGGSDLAARRLAEAEGTEERGGATLPVTRWRLGCAEADALLGPGGLTVDGVHEVKPALAETGGCHAGDWAAALAFVLRLVRRRLVDAARQSEAPVLMWCQSRQAAGELGRLYAPGLQCLGIDPQRVLVVETMRREETLWAMEEGLASGALVLVAGSVDDIALTPARRLALRAARHRTPCLVLTSPRGAPTAATATRWRIACHRGARHPFDPRAPGPLRLAASLERCRQRPFAGAAQTFTLDWSDEAHRFDMAPGLADRADGARPAGRRVA